MTNIQAKHWADKVASGILKWQAKQAEPIGLHVDDMKTPSGRVHTGSLRGVVLHDVIAQVLVASADQPIVNTYVFNDMDPMDGLPGYLDEAEYTQHMGKPLHRIPAPPLEHSGLNLELVTPEELQRFEAASSFGEFYALDFIDAFRKLGCTQEIVGAMNFMSRAKWTRLFV
jgi:lysyl-tRNA synthetase class 1